MPEDHKTQAASFRAALIRIATLTKPGQTLDIYQAIDLICDVWNEARVALTEREDA